MLKNTQRASPMTIDKDEFTSIGHTLVSQLAAFYDTIRQRPVTGNAGPADLAAMLGNRQVPEEGKPASELLAWATKLVMDQSLLNGHPRFMGFITSSPTQIGALADLLASAVNPNVGANILSPIATAIEKQTVQWLSEFIGVPQFRHGLLVSGGNFANFTGFLAARTSRAPQDLKEKGLQGLARPMVFYCSRAAHTWVEKAAILFGHGRNAIRWIDVLLDNTMDLGQLEDVVRSDLANGCHPFLLIGNAGDVSTGAVDKLGALARIAKKYDMWFHIDGAYGIPAAALPEYRDLFLGMEEADSIALDPHKWLYAPLEAGCVLVKDQQHLLDTYSAHPSYYNFEGSDGDNVLNYYEYGFQNSRSFRALKVWLALQQAGMAGYREMIRDDIELAKLIYQKANAHPELEAVSQHLSITAFQYKPSSYEGHQEWINQINMKLVDSLQKGGEMFLSDAVIGNRYCLRTCIVNYRTTIKDIDESINIIVREGRKIHESMTL